MATALFFFSKIAWFLLSPLNSLLFCLLAWLGCRRAGWKWLAGLFLTVLLLYGGAIFLTPLPELIVQKLENRFPVPTVVADNVAGIILLGGAASDGAVAAARGQTTLNGAAERITTAIALHRAMPDKPFIVSGFSGQLFPRGWNEVENTSWIFKQQGVDLSHVRFEDESRTTAENAHFTAEMVGPDEKRPWLLVTSAWHMPRSVASFRAVGVSVLPYPVDFQTEPTHLAWPRDPTASLGFASIALHEWLGLFAYYVTGNSSELFPAPR